MQRVLQKNNKDCGVAALAMLLNKRYETISKKLQPMGLPDEDGITRNEMLKILRDLKPRKIKSKPRGKRKYLVLINWGKGKGRHWVVQDENGIIYDPYIRHKNRKSLNNYPGFECAITV